MSATSSSSGAQWTLRRGDQQVTVVQVGGGLRSYTAGGVDVLAGYGPEERAPYGRGQLLMPWPNRIRDGLYSFDGIQHQLPLSEPERHNASHGLVRWASWELQSQEPEAVTVTHALFPQPGWDGRLDLKVRYQLDNTGLTVRTTATNVGTAGVPFGCGAHPYVALGEVPLADVVLGLTASQEVLVDERMLPVGTRAVSPDHDFRQPRPLGTTRLDTAFAGVARGADGRWRVTVDTGRGRVVEVWGDEAFGWVQVFTAQGEDSGVPGARGIAVEPMSCPADAFNSGEGVVVLEPAQSWTGTWGVGVTSV